MAARKATSEHRSGSRTRILVVDDNEDNRDIYATSLAHAGYAVELARDGEEAIDVATRVRPEVVIMDLGMPGMDGWAAIRELRARSETRAAYVIVVSGFADSISRRRAREAGCDEFIAKPCLPKALVERVNDVLSKKRTHE